MADEAQKIFRVSIHMQGRADYLCATVNEIELKFFEANADRPTTNFLPINTTNGRTIRVRGIEIQAYTVDEVLS